MNWQFLVGPFTDPYERRARVYPGLLLLLPLLILLCCAYGPNRPVPTVFLSLAVTVGGVYALAAISRANGKRLEEKMIKKWGGLPTTIVLRHRDAHYNRYTKEKLHRQLSALAKLPMPIRQDEDANPVDADHRYTAATDQLRQRTRGDKFNHLRRENTAYGFYRNALSLKFMGLLTTVGAMVGGALLGDVLSVRAPYVIIPHLMAPGIPASIAMVSATLIGGLWLSFTKKGLWRVGTAYADRLFECLDELTTP
jgi:hypothetical protein